MEKQRMEGRGQWRSGLLKTSARLLRSLAFAGCCLAAASSPPSAAAESGPEEPLRLLVFVSPERPSTDAAFVVTLLVDYPDPSRVSARPPAPPPTLTLERSRVEPRLQSGSGGSEERWTAIEFAYSISADEDFELGPFEVEVPGKTARTDGMTIRVGRSAGRPAAHAGSSIPRLLWLEVPSALGAGESAEALLALSGAEASRAATVSAAAPENALMETLPLKPEDRGRGVIGRFRLTALEPPGFRLPAVSVALDDAKTLISPTGSVAVSAKKYGAAAVPPARVPSLPQAGTRKAAPTGPVPFPEPSPPWPIGPLTQKPIALARSAWIAGDYRTALATLRSAERDTAAGFAVRAVRRDAEGALGILDAMDEEYAPVAPLSGLAVAASLGSLAALFRRRRVTSGRRRGYTVAIVLATVAFASIGRLAWVRLEAAGLLGRGGSAVVYSCEVRRIPEAESEVTAGLAAGEAVRIRSSAGSWAYVEASDGRAGWIEGRGLIRY